MIKTVKKIIKKKIVIFTLYIVKCTFSISDMLKETMLVLQLSSSTPAFL